MRRLSARSMMLTLTLLVGSVTPAAAHELKAEVRTGPKVVEIFAFYGKKERAQNAEVQVLDGAGKLYAGGRTDLHGKWSFDRPADGRYTIIIDSGDGHRKEMTLSVDSNAKADADPADSIVVSGNSSMEDHGAPWPYLAIGVFAIAGFAAALWLARRGAKVG